MAASAGVEQRLARCPDAGEITLENFTAFAQRETWGEGARNASQASGKPGAAATVSPPGPPAPGEPADDDSDDGDAR